MIAKRVDDLTALRARLAEAGAAIARERATHADTQTALQQRVVDVERLAQQARVLGRPSMKRTSHREPRRSFRRSGAPGTSWHKRFSIRP